MSTLTGQKIANSYKNLLQVSNNNSGVDGTLRSVEDGEGTNTPLQLSNAAVNINGPSAFQLNGVTLTVTASVLNDVATSAQLAAVSSRITSVSDFAVNLSTTFATSINNSNITIAAVSALTSVNKAAITSINTVVANVSALTSVNKAAITSINTVIDNLDFATSAELAAVSALTSVNKAAITSINTVIDNLDYATSAELAAVSALTSVNKAAITSINTVIDNLDYATSAELAAVSALTSVNKAAITSINTVIDNLDYATSAELAAVSSTLATSINNSNITIAAVSALTSVNKAAITSINTVIDNLDFATSAELAAVSSTLATSISNHLRLSGGTLVGQLIGTSATFSGTVCATTFYGDGSNLTGITTSVPTSVLTYTVNQLTVVSNATFSGPVSGTSAIFTGIVSANEFDALIGSFSTSVSIGANLNVTGAVSGTSGIFAGTVSVNEIDASIGSFNGAVSVGGAINIVGAVSGTSAIFTGIVSANEFDALKGSFSTSVSIGANLNVTGAVSGTSAIFTGIVSANEFDALIGSFSTSVSIGANLNVTGAVSGTSAIFTGIVSANEFDALIGSFSTSVSIGANLNVTGAVSGTSAIFTGIVSANEFDALIGSFSTSVSIGANLNVTGAVSGTSGIFTGTVSVNEIDASIGSFNGAVSVGGAINIVGAVSGTSAIFTGIVSANQFTAPTGSFSTNIATPRVSATGSSSILTFATSGVDRMTITSAGDVGIGTLPDGGVRLDVRGGVFQFLGTGGNTGQLLTDASGLTLKNVSNGYMLFGTNNTERMRIPSGGGLLVGCTAVPSSTVAGRRIEVGSGATTSSSGADTAAYSHWTFFNGNGAVGSIQTNGSATSYVTSSDYRLKYNIAPMIGALAKVAALNPVTYKWKSDNSDGQGFIAHELQEVVPECVTGKKDETREEEYEVTPAIPAVVDAEGVEVTPAVEAVKGTRTVPSYQGVDTSFLVATLVAAIKELKVIIDAQATRIDALENK